MCGHEHEHDHAHCHACETHTPEEALALLAYMIDHNRHHTDELHDLARDTDGEAKELIHAAVIGFEQANAKLEKALLLLKKQNG